MRIIAIKVLENNLSEYMRLAREGEMVLISEGDRVVAELGPPRPERPSLVGDAVVAELVSEGILQPAASSRSGVPASLGIATTAELLAELARDREDRSSEGSATSR